MLNFFFFFSIAYWVKHNKKTGRNERDGYYWTYGTHADIAEQFEYLSQKQVRTAIDKLVTADYIKVGRYNKHKYDRTSRYTLTEKGSSLLLSGFEQMPIKAQGRALEVVPIPNNKTITNNTDIIAKAEALRARLAEG